MSLIKIAIILCLALLTSSAAEQAKGYDVTQPLMS
jgi:hypothetical protein